MNDAEKEIKRALKREERSRRHRLYLGLKSNSMRIHPGNRVSYERLPDEKDLMHHVLDCPGQDAMFDPDERQRFGKDGAWAMIVRKLPPVGGKGIEERVRVGRIFYLEHVPNTDEYGFTMDGYYKVLCRTKWGDVCLWPWEYSVMSTTRVLELWQLKDLTFHPTNVQLARFNDIVFYARSRGIGLADAMVMALGTLKGPIGWFEPATKELALACEDLEAAVHKPWVSRRTLKTPMAITLEVKQ